MEPFKRKTYQGNSLVVSFHEDGNRIHYRSPYVSCAAKEAKRLDEKEPSVEHFIFVWNNDDYVYSLAEDKTQTLSLKGSIGSIGIYRMASSNSALHGSKELQLQTTVTRDKPVSTFLIFKDDVLKYQDACIEDAIIHYNEINNES